MNPELKINKRKYIQFYNELGKHYPEEEIVYKSLRGMLRSRFIKKYLDSIQGSLLDIGCNKGIYLVYYKNGWKSGVDISKEILFKAKKELQDNKVDDFFLIAGDAENLSFFRENTFDNILFSETLEHLINPEQALSEAFRILKSDGKLLITTPNYKNKKPYLQDIGFLKLYIKEGFIGNQYIHTAFRPEELTEMLRKKGFIIVKQGTFEKEIKVTAKIPGLLFRIIDLFNRGILRNKKLEELNIILFEKISFMFYKLLIFFRLESIIERKIKEGVRSYVVAHKHMVK